MRQGYILTLLPFTIVLEFLVRAIKQEKEIVQEEIKLSLFVYDMILYSKDLKDSTKKFLRSDKHFQQNSRLQNKCTKISNYSIYQ
jgi:hypothetical protein